MTSQLNRLKQEMRELSIALDDTERSLNLLPSMLHAAEARGDKREAQEIAKYIDDKRKEKTELLDRWTDVHGAIRASHRGQLSRLKTKGKRQAALLKAAISAVPGEETIDYAVTTGLSEDRVRTLARILASDGQIVRRRRSRWNGMHYLDYYEYYPVETVTADGDIPF